MKKLAIVTGGSSGLGLSIAKLLIEKDIDVCILGRSIDKLEAAKEKLNHDVMTACMDVSDEMDVENLYERFDHLDYLFNVAGIGRFGSVEAIDSKMIDEVLSVNLKGLMLMTSHGLKRMNKGKIINVMSTAGQVGKKNEALYCASKWGARGFTESLKVTYKNSPIQIIGVYPGGMNTPFWNASHVNAENFMTPEDVAKIIVDAVCHDLNVNVNDIIIERS
jgi:NADP-dependent 3-hydroxy acid dehydrogenase YdfG